MTYQHHWPFVEECLCVEAGDLGHCLRLGGLPETERSMSLAA